MLGVVNSTHYHLVAPYVNIKRGQHRYWHWLVPFRCQSITWTNTDLPFILPQGAKFSETADEIRKIILRKRIWKRRPKVTILIRSQCFKTRRSYVVLFMRKGYLSPPMWQYLCFKDRVITVIRQMRDKKTRAFGWLMACAWDHGENMT